METTTVRCACGDLSLEIEGDTSDALSAICHCGMCREMTGAPNFWGNGFTPDRITVRGETTCFVRQTNRRHSCAKCGAYLFEEVPAFGVTMVSAAQMDQPAPPMMHIFVADKIYPLPEDGLPRFDAMPPSE